MSDTPRRAPGPPSFLAYQMPSIERDSSEVGDACNREAITAQPPPEKEPLKAHSPSFLASTTRNLKVGLTPSFPAWAGDVVSSEHPMRVRRTSGDS